MGNSLYGNVINPPKSFQSIKINNNDSITVENSGPELILVGDNSNIKIVKNSDNEIEIKHTLPHNGESNQTNVNIGELGGDSQQNLIYIKSMNIDPQGHVINAQLETAIIKPVGERTEDGGEIFNDYNNNIATEYAHAEGQRTLATGTRAHSEGIYTHAHGPYSHSEGQSTHAFGRGAHSEGYNTYTWTNASHAEGNMGIAIGNGSHAEGYHALNYDSTIPLLELNNISLAQGTKHIEHENFKDILKNNQYYYFAFSSNKYIWYLGQYVNDSLVLCPYSFDSGNIQYYSSSCLDRDINNNTFKIYEALGIASGIGSHIEGGFTRAQGENSHAEGRSTQAFGQASHAEGQYTFAGDEASHAEGYGTSANGSYSHAEGQDSIVDGEAGHAEGYGNAVYYPYGHAEGYSNWSDNEGAHAEGEWTYVSGKYAHGEGTTGAYGDYSHAEGYNTYSSGKGSHSGGGNQTEASGDYSFAHGNNVQTPVGKESTVVFGKYNDNVNNSNKIFQFGWGNSNNRKDIMYLTNTGEMYANEFINQNNKSLTNIDQDLQQSKEDLKFTYDYDAATQQLTFIQGTTLVGTISVPINAVVNNADMIEGTTKLKLTVNVLTEEGAVIPKELELDLGEIALDQALLGDTDTITLYQEEEDKLQKIKGRINQNKVLGGENGHLAEKTISAFNIKENAIENYSVKDGAISNSKLSTSNDELGAAVNTNNIVDYAITSSKLHNAIGEEAVVTGVIRDGAITNSKIKDNAITTDKLAVKTKEMEAAVSTATIQDGAVTNSKLYSDPEGIKSAVSTDTIQNNAITKQKLSQELQNTLEEKMNKSNPEGTGSFSFNKSTSSIMGTNSILLSTGSGSNASGEGSAAIGFSVEATGMYAQAYGYDTVASGYNSHAEGSKTKAKGANSHAEGSETETIGSGAHAEGARTLAQGTASHSEGVGTVAYGHYQHVQGRNNIEDRNHKYAHIVGNGVLEEKDADGNIIVEQTYSNAHTLDWDGNAWYAGSIETNDKIILRSSSIKEDGTRSDKKFAISIDDNAVLLIEEV